MNVQGLTDSQARLEDQLEQQGVPDLIRGNDREDALDFFPAQPSRMWGRNGGPLEM